MVLGFVEVRCNPPCNKLFCKATPGSTVEAVCSNCGSMVVRHVEKS